MPVYAMCFEVWQPTEIAGTLIRHSMCKLHSCTRGKAEYY